jgi:hypothetical protein
MSVGAGAEKEVGYGFVLRNPSSTEDAEDVGIDVRILGASGQVIETDSAALAAVPAGTTYYFGGRVTVPDSAAPSKVEASITIGERVAKAAVMPAVSNVQRAASDEGGVDVTAEYSNPSSRTLTNTAWITAVALNAAGDVIGGGYTFTFATMPPGGRAQASVRVVGITLAQTASTQLTVEPSYE